MRLWVEVVCALCNDTTAGKFVSGTVAKMDFSREAREYGWKQIELPPERGGYVDWCCKECLKQHRADKRMEKKNDSEFEY